MTDFETLSPDWLPVRGALDRILRHASPLATETVALAQAGGRALAEELRAPLSLPPWDNSAMDGYAVRGEEIAEASPARRVTLEVIGERRAGDHGSAGEGARELRSGTAIRIMTGAPVPPGADSVVRVEDTDAEERAGTVRIHSNRDRNRNIRPGGEDMREGDLLLSPGEWIGPGQIAVAATLGRKTVSVHRRPRAAILSSGDELAPVEEYEEVLRGRAIPESNRPMLAAAVRSSGALAHDLGIAKDTRASIRSHILRAADSDLLLTTGGASMGEADLIKRVLDDLGYELDFWRVRLRPGSPFSLGLLSLEGKREPLPVFGLPGNPGSAFVTFEVLVRPFLLRLMGFRHPFRPTVRALAGEKLAGAGGLTNFLRIVLQGRRGVPEARLAGLQGSGLVTNLGRARGLAVLREEVTEIAAGDPVDVILLDGEAEWIEEPPY